VPRPSGRTLVERQAVPQQSGRGTSAGIVSLQGAKGGVGVSTVALNLATVLAGRGKTILAEMRPGQGMLSSQFRLRRKIRTLADLAAVAADRITAADLESCLWPCPGIPGLSILFGPPTLDSGVDWAAPVAQILRLAVGTADYVLADLPHCFSSVNRGALRATDYFLLVLERDSLCIDAGKLMLGALEAENLLPHSAAAVVVSRVSLAAPMDLSEVERELNLSILGSVPPDPDLCMRAYRSETTVVTLDPESILAASYARLAEALPATLRVRRPQYA
jgi:MinD-like ATPase involved in chromosome partitioning or flagellar assembly